MKRKELPWLWYLFTAVKKEKNIQKKKRKGKMEGWKRRLRAASEEYSISSCT